MSGPPPEIEESDVLLQRAARLDMMLLEKINARALDSDDTGEIATMARAQASVGRSLRRHLALLHKLKADRARAAREAEKPAGRTSGDTARKTPEEHAREARADHLVNALERVISRVADGDRDRHTDLIHRFERELDDWYEAPEFLDLAPQAHVRHACRVLGLPEDLADTWPDLPEPTFFPDPEPRSRAPGELEFDAAPPAHPDSAGFPLSDTG